MANKGNGLWLKKMNRSKSEKNLEKLHDMRKFKFENILHSSFMSVKAQKL